MDPRVSKILNIILGSLLFLSLVLLLFFGLRLASVNKIKASELKSQLTKREQEIAKACQLDKEKTKATYTADEIFGNFQFSYPKIWNTYVAKIDSDPPLQFLANPELIVVENGKTPDTAMRVAVYNAKYSSKTAEYEAMTSGNAKSFQVDEVTLSALKGKKFTGSKTGKEGKIISFVLLPLRDKTLYIGTDDFAVYSKEYNDILNSFKISK